MPRLLPLPGVRRRPQGRRLQAAHRERRLPVPSVRDGVEETVLVATPFRR
ncbi:hypothetical protein BN2537_157 [Streptomyces venezuelae]|nr:hypothetical protein BN2537_157 [Streptomyces venezuelae]